MRPVVSISAQTVRGVILTGLQETGQARCLLVDLTVDADVWRSLARKAAHELGRMVQTLETDDQVVAVLRDWPRNDDERAITRARLRATIDAMEKPST